MDLDLHGLGLTPVQNHVRMMLGTTVDPSQTSGSHRNVLVTLVSRSKLLLLEAFA